MAIDPDQIKAMKNINPNPQETNIRKELEQQKEILLKIYENTRKTRRYIMIGKIISFIYFLLIVVPIILAVIYLPPLMEGVVAPYQELLGQTENLKGIDVNKVNDILNQFNK